MGNCCDDVDMTELPVIFKLFLLMHGLEVLCALLGRDAGSLKYP